MGREIRRVPANWEHPKKEVADYRKGIMVERFQPLHDSSYIDAMNEWIKEHKLWERGKHRDQDAYYRYYAQYGGNAPDVEYYRPDWKSEEMTWYQVYETVSEGTPVTPPFETQSELVDYLVDNGDFWDQERRKEPKTPWSMNCDPWPRNQAEKFVYGSGYAPSLVVENGVVMTGVEALYGKEDAAQ